MFTNMLFAGASMAILLLIGMDTVGAIQIGTLNLIVFILIDIHDELKRRNDSSR